MTDDRKAATGGQGGEPETGTTGGHPADTTDNTEASTADMDAWTVSTEREEGRVTAADGGVAGTDDP